jgi:hypothetical protein
MIRKILALCARDTGHEVMYSQLEQTLFSFEKAATVDSWNKLLYMAEKQGLAPLLYHHSQQISFQFPANFTRLLRSLYLRARQANSLRTNAVTEILTWFAAADLQVLTVKGIALCHFLYKEPGLRPMRDIDLLVSEKDLAAARKILLNHDYLPAEQHDTPEDYYHLPPLVKNIAGLPVTIELHRNLFPAHPRYPVWPLEKLYSNTHSFNINTTTAHTLSLEETLWYVYLHGFQAPLTYEPFRLIHVADIVSLIEKYPDQLDLRFLQKKWPVVTNVLSRFHSLTPLQEQVIKHFHLPVKKYPHDAGRPYQGWPQHRFKKTSLRKLPQLLRDTFFPSRWWVQLYYGHLEGYGYWHALLFEHPRTVWRWMKDYFFLYMASSSDAAPKKER